MSKRTGNHRAQSSEMRGSGLRSESATRAENQTAPKRIGAVVAVCLGLVAVTLAVYWQTTKFGFINDDDPDYVINNPHVLGGLTWDSFRWAFHLGNAANWHPITWLTHMLDCAFWGTAAGQLEGSGGHHLTNVLLHIGSVLFLFTLLNRLTARLWPSALVAVVFAIHPLHAESVAWVSERKDVLSAFLMMVTLWCYARYATEGSVAKYVLTLVVFGLGLMSKQMLVTVPIVLLLLDYWPLNRFSPGANPRPARLVLEKVPLLVMSVIAGVLLLLSQKAGGAIASTEHFPLMDRVTNAIVTCVVYILDLFWPKNLAHYYPHEGVHWAVWQIVGSALVLIAVTLVSVRLARTRPYLIVGWLWYVITLLPVIGLVQVGGQARADRYTYIPSIGVCIMVAFGLADVVSHFLRNVANPVLGVTTVGVMGALIVPAFRQVGYWHDSETLYRHTLAVTQTNCFAHSGLGSVLSNEAQLLRAQGRIDEANAKTSEAIGHLNEALKINPALDSAHAALGVAYMAAGDVENGIAESEKALKYKPNDALLECNIGSAYVEKGDYENAIKYLRLSVQHGPTRWDSHYALALAYERSGAVAEAIAEFRKVLTLHPDDLDGYWASEQIAVLLPEENKQEAIELLQRAVEINQRAHVDPKNAAAKALERLRKESGNPATSDGHR